MGNKYVVLAYTQLRDGEYQYIESYRGESFFAAIWDMYKCKKQGSGCVRLEWRG